MKKDEKVFWGYLFFSILFFVIGCLVLPSLIGKCGTKLYRYSLKRKKTDFDNQGPEIVKKGEA